MPKGVHKVPLWDPKEEQKPSRGPKRSPTRLLGDPKCSPLDHFERFLDDKLAKLHILKILKILRVVPFQMKWRKPLMGDKILPREHFAGLELPFEAFIS